jgi:hypothetical protein
MINEKRGQNETIPKHSSWICCESLFLDIAFSLNGEKWWRNKIVQRLVELASIDPWKPDPRSDSILGRKIKKENE